MKSLAQSIETLIKGYVIVPGRFNFQIVSCCHFYEFYSFVKLIIISAVSHKINLGKIFPYESPIFSKIIGIRAYGLRSPKWVGI